MRPSLPPEFLPRPRLMERLDAGSRNPVTLIVAPAGYGKSTLLTEWLGNTPRRAGWLALGERHNSFGLFCSHLLAAIQSVFPDSLPVTTGMLHSGVSPNPGQLAATLSDEIAELPEEFVLILDDYHLIRENTVHELLSDLLRNMPPPLHLVIVTRAHVALPFGKLRAAGQLFELHARDLLFTLDEARDYLRRAIGPEISEEIVQRLYQRIEGWAVGLRFTSILLREGKPTPEALERLAGSDRQMMDYLLDEVLGQRAPAVQEFLLKTSLVERFTAKLCDAIFDFPARDSSYAILDELVRDDLLSVEYDANEKWYKYLDLFREFLSAAAMARYKQRTVTDVHRRASRWFREQGMITDAIHHAIEAGNMKFAAQVVGENIQMALDHPPARPQIESWLGLFPPTVLDEQPELVLARVWLFSIALKLAAIPPLLAHTEELLATVTDLDHAARRRMMGEIAYHRIFLAYFGGEGQRVLELVSENAEILRAGGAYARGNILYIESLSYQIVGKTDVALQRLTDALQRDASVSPEFTFRLMTAFATIYLNEADLFNLASSCTTILRMEQEHLSLGKAAAHNGLGWAHYEWNQLEVAAQHFAAATELSYAGNQRVTVEGFGWLVLTRQAQGAADASDESLRKLLNFADETHEGAMLYAADAYRARLALVQGDVDAALHWAQGVAFNPRPHLLFDVEANLTRLHILLATRKVKYLRIMQDETDALLSVAQSMHNPRRILQLYALQAMARDALGNRDLALESLEQAVRLAEPGGLLRTFIDLGPGMARLLNLLARQNKSSAFIYRILAVGAQNKTGRAAFSGLHDDPEYMFEPLSLRELDVLKGLVLRRSNREIAQQLVVSTNTVNAHIDHIYQKLGVNDRQRAVQVALAYGIVEVPSTASFIA